MKEMMNRTRSGKPLELSQLDNSEIIKERDHYTILANQCKQDYENLKNEFNDYKGVGH